MMLKLRDGIYRLRGKKQNKKRIKPVCIRYSRDYKNFLSAIPNISGVQMRLIQDCGIF